MKSTPSIPSLSPRTHPLTTEWPLRPMGAQGLRDRIHPNLTVQCLLVVLAFVCFTIARPVEAMLWTNW